MGDLDLKSGQFDTHGYDETHPYWYATTSSAPATNTLYIAEADIRSTDLVVDKIRVAVGATSNGNLKVCVYTFDGTTWTLAASSASTAVGAINTIQTVSMQTPAVIPRGVRRFYGLVSDGTATFQRMAGVLQVAAFLEPSLALKASSFTLPATMVLADLTATNLGFWLKASPS